MTWPIAWLLFEESSAYQWPHHFVLISPPFPFSSSLIGRLSSYQSFLDILNEMNDYAGQRELIAENMMMSICIDLTKYLQELKQERKTVSLLWRGPGVSQRSNDTSNTLCPGLLEGLLQLHLELVNDYVMMGFLLYFCFKLIIYFLF